MQHKGDLIVTGEFEQNGQVTGTTFVRDGGNLVCHGQLSGGLIIDSGGEATINGQVSRNVVNHGELWLYGQISGRLVGNAQKNSIGPNQIVGADLEVPFRGTTHSYTIEE